mmetsp:Transcript_25281/g.73961  ORF Transcript_25281/g.73961 Transcript_25281/m.73961 type:complete len:314 (+) Transcript_25281:400-1341(+)
MLSWMIFHSTGRSTSRGPTARSLWLAAGLRCFAPSAVRRECSSPKSCSMRASVLRYGGSQSSVWSPHTSTRAGRRSNTPGDVRTSWNAWIDAPAEKPVLGSDEALLLGVQKRVASLVRQQPVVAEPMQVVRYRSGQHYHYHNDAGDGDQDNNPSRARASPAPPTPIHVTQPSKAQRPRMGCVDVHARHMHTIEFWTERAARARSRRTLSHRAGLSRRCSTSTTTSKAARPTSRSSTVAQSRCATCTACGTSTITVRSRRASPSHQGWGALRSSTICCPTRWRRIITPGTARATSPAARSGPQTTGSILASCTS